MAVKVGNRGADGVPEVDEHMGEKARAEDDEVPIKPEAGLKVGPAGLAALEGKRDDDMVMLINLQLGTFSFDRVAWEKPPIRDTKQHPSVAVTVGAFQSFTIRVDLARTLLATQEKGKRTRKAKLPKIVVAPPEGNCKMQQFFQTRDGRRFQTCSFRSCPHHSGHDWSVWFAQHFIKLKHRDYVIRHFYENVDRRADVVIFGSHVADVRRRQQDERLGIAQHAQVGMH